MMGAGSFGLLRGGCYSSFTTTTNYQRPVLALLPSAATTTTTSTSTIATATSTSSSISLSLSLRLQHLFSLRDNKKLILTTAAATTPISLSISPDAYNYGSGGPSPLLLQATPPSFILRRNTPSSRTLLQWKCCFCTSPSSSSSSTVVNADDDNDDMTKIKQAANTLDIRVGKIRKAWMHEEADSLFVEEVDVGEAEPRIICSGLVKYIPLHQLQGINVVVLANLKPRNMRGVKSSGMLMAASDALHENVELLVPPEGSVPGQRIWFGSLDEKETLPDVASPNQIQKKKVWEQVQPHLTTDDSCIAALGMHAMRTTEGVVVCRSLKNARIS